MRFRTLIFRSLRFHWRSHLGVLLGAAIGSAALIGALVVGDSVRESLRRMAILRLGNIQHAMETGDRHFRSGIAELVEQTFGELEWRNMSREGNPRPRFYSAAGTSSVINLPVTVSNRLAAVTYTNSVQLAAGQRIPFAIFSLSETNYRVQVNAALRLKATASAQGGQARANHVQLLGITPSFALRFNNPAFSNLPPDSVILNDALARQLHVSTGEVITIRTRKPDALGGDSPLSPQDESAVALRLRVHRIVPGEDGGNFNLTASQTPPQNAFVDLKMLQEQMGVPHRANLLVTDTPHRTWRQQPKFSWVQWLGQQLRKVNVNLIRSRSLVEIDPLSPAESSERLNRTLDRLLSLSDLQLQLTSGGSRNEMELRSPRVFLDAPVADSVLQGATNSNAAQILKGVKPYGVLTYLVNLLRHGERTTPYSMVTAAGSPLVPADLGDNEIIISQWLAEDLDAKVGSDIELTWFDPDRAAQLVEASHRFRVREILPMDHPSLDRTLMPDFPGVAGAEQAGDWETGFPLVHKIREKDDEYWSKYRGTPKAFVSLTAGQKLWSSRQGNLTAIRFPAPPDRNEQFWYLHQLEVERVLKSILVPKADLSNVDTNIPALFSRTAIGLQFRDVRTEALAGASQSQDFGGLFIGFSFFLILAALILMALLFQFGIEQRTNEVGTLLALGFTPRRVRKLLMGEGIILAFIGGLIGVAAGVGYAKAMLYGLTTLWRDAVGASTLRFHATSTTLLIGLFASTLVCAVTIWIVLRKQARRPARDLLAEGAGVEEGQPELKPESREPKAEGSPKAEIRTNPGASRKPRRGFAPWIAITCGIGALAMVGWALASGDSSSAGLFFGAGGLLLVAELAAVALLFRALARSEVNAKISLSILGWRNCTRRRSRSLASVALLACGSFLVAAIGANRLDAGRDATKRSSGTGGFALLGESSLPVVRDLNTASGREFYNLDESEMKGVSVVPFRVREGDDASCLNLSRAQTPRLLGVKPELMAERNAFTFAKAAKGLDVKQGWNLLRGGPPHPGPLPQGGEGVEPETRNSKLETDIIPAIGDAASIQWALGKKLGDTIDFTDERGRPFKVRLVAGVANSILQGNLLIDEAEFVKRFPGESGHRMFLIDTPSNTGAELEKVSATLSRALQDVGLELTPTTQRLAAFNAVQNTYLNTFQVLGGIGLLLGSAGLGVVVLRNVLERRGELGLLQAIGFRRRLLQRIVLSEHSRLLWLGLAVGITSALIAVLPALVSPGAELHYTALGVTLALVFISGLLWTWLATRLALRGELLKALRNE